MCPSVLRHTLKSFSYYKDVWMEQSYIASLEQAIKVLTHCFVLKSTNITVLPTLSLLICKLC
jgi:hypothetical protein